MDMNPKVSVGQTSGEFEWPAQREQWTRDVTGLMALVTIVAAVLIALSTLAGFFIFVETLPVYVVLALITPAWWGARRGGWRWARYFPALLCFGLGFYVTFYAGFLTIFVLFYALAVLLAAMLVRQPDEHAGDAGQHPRLYWPGRPGGWFLDRDLALHDQLFLRHPGHRTTAGIYA